MPIYEYLCADCSKGQYPADTELDVTGLESSPGVRRMEAVVGSEMPFAPGREPMKLLAGLDVTAKAIERAADMDDAAVLIDDDAVAYEPVRAVLVADDPRGCD